MIANDIKAAYSRTKWMVALRGILGIALGIYILARPLQSLAGFALFIAIWAILDGSTTIGRAFALRGIVPHWGVLVTAGALGVVFGIAALYYYPGLSLSVAVWWVSLWLLTGGAMATYVAVLEKRANVPWGWTMTLGVVTIVCGVLAIVYPGITLAALMGLIAAFGILSGITMLVGAAKLQSFQNNVQYAMRS